MAEYFDVITPNGRETGLWKTREAVHRDGDWHKSVHIWVYAGGKFLFQKRKEDKDSFPGMWDAGCTGHVDAGETWRKAALRELAEELGLTVRHDRLEYIAVEDLCVVQSGEKPFVSNEKCCIYLLQMDEQPEIAFQAEEISAVQWLDTAEADKLVGSRTCCILSEEYKKVKCYLKPKITPIRPGDEKELYTLFYDTVHEICRRDYTRAERHAWAPHETDLPAWSARFWESTALCARADGKIAAFGNIYENGYLDCLYVQKDFAGCSLGRRMLQALEVACPAETIRVRASKTAKPFFEKYGYRTVKGITVTRAGCALICFEMEKHRTPQGAPAQK